MVLTGAASRKALLKIIWLNCFSCDRRAVKGVRTSAHVRRALVELFLWCYLTLPKHPSSSNVQVKQQAQLRIVYVAQLRIV